jgi:hypothetical protein
MLGIFQIHWTSVTFKKYILSNMRYMVKEKTELLINVT